MIDLSIVLSNIAKSIVDHPDEVSVTEHEEGNEILLTLSVAEEDMGMIIGKRGKIAKAIRTVMKNVAKTDDKKVTVEIKWKMGRLSPYFLFFYFSAIDFF